MLKEIVLVLLMIIMILIGTALVFYLICMGIKELRSKGVKKDER